MLNKKLQKNFTIADNRIMQCEGLSFEARGLYLYMLSLPDGWEFSEYRLAKNGGIGIDKCKRILKELFCIGLLKREFIHNKKGHKKSVYTLYDFSTLENPTLENPTLENPTLENPMNNKIINNNKELNLNKELYIEKEKNIIKKEKDFKSFENVEVVETQKANNEAVSIPNEFSTSNIVSISNELAFNSYEVVETPRINKNLVLWESEEDKLLEKEFDLFYSLYPRKTSKMNAKSAFKKLRLGQHKNFRKTKIPLDNILLALSSLIKQIGRNGTKIEYIPYPASWLNSNDFLSVTDDETALLPQDNETCLNEIKEMLKKMAEVMNEKFKENPQFKKVPEYKIIHREILTKCILKIKDICNKHNVCFYKYYGFYDDGTTEYRRYKWYLEKSFSDWVKESIRYKREY